MIIRFKKGKNQWKHRPDTLTCVRDDGSVTWAHLHRGFVLHDFAHYVVETTLGFKNAFFGLVAKGHDIPDFSEPQGSRPFEIPKEATDIEPIVALLQIDVSEGLWGSSDDAVFRDQGASLPINITDQQFEVMQQKLRRLLQQWRDLQPGEAMVLQFET